MVTYGGTVIDDPDLHSVFKALADPSRRFLLDLLYERDGRTLTELESELVDAIRHDPLRRDEAPQGARRSGPRGHPTAGPGEAALPQPGADPARSTTGGSTSTRSATSPRSSTSRANWRSHHDQHRAPPVTTTQVYRVYIKPRPTRSGPRITDPEWTDRYGYGGYVHYDLKPGGALVVNPGQEMIDGRRGPGLRAARRDHRRRGDRGRPARSSSSRRGGCSWTRGRRPSRRPRSPTRSTRPATASARSRSSTSCPSSPLTAALTAGSDDLGGGGGGHPWILSDLKSLLETGKRMAD